MEGDEAEEAEGEEDVEGGLEGPSRERGHPVAPAGLGEHHLAVVVRPDAVELRLKGVRRLLQIGEHSFSGSQVLFTTVADVFCFLLMLANDFSC